MPAEAEVVAAWERLERLIEAIEPSLLVTLAPGCDADDLVTLDVAVPEVGLDRRVGLDVLLEPLEGAGWIPFAGSDGFNLCIDVDPGPEGTPGQVIVMDHETGPRDVLAPSLSAWLSLWADEIEAGVFEAAGHGLDVRGDRTSRAFR